MEHSGYNILVVLHLRPHQQVKNNTDTPESCPASLSKHVKFDTNSYLTFKSETERFHCWMVMLQTNRMLILAS